MPGARSLAAAQTVPVAGDVEANLEQHLRLARLAAAEGARLVVFPELSLTGYELGLAAELAVSPGEPRLAPLAEAASSGGVTLVVGAPVRLGARLHIGGLVIAPDGPMEVYTKHHLGAFSPLAGGGGPVPPAEATVFDPGERDPLVRVDGELAAVAVCADTGRPSHPRRAATRGATTYLASMFVIPSDLERESANLRARAREHGLAIACANYGGPTGGLAAAGGSAIWSERGEPLARLGPAGAGIAVAVERAAGWRGGTVALGFA